MRESNPIQSSMLPYMRGFTFPTLFQPSSPYPVGNVTFPSWTETEPDPSFLGPQGDGLQS